MKRREFLTAAGLASIIPGAMFTNKVLAKQPVQKTTATGSLAARRCTPKLALFEDWASTSKENRKNKRFNWRHLFDTIEIEAQYRPELTLMCQYVEKNVQLGDRLIKKIFQHTIDKKNSSFATLYNYNNLGYTMPGHGRMPERHSELKASIGVPYYDIGSSCNWSIDNPFRQQIQSRMQEYIVATHESKIKDDAWHTILAAAVDRNILVYDEEEKGGTSRRRCGRLTPRLINIMSEVMGRNSMHEKGKMTDLCVCNCVLIDFMVEELIWCKNEMQARQYLKEMEYITYYGVNIHPVLELAEHGGQYQKFYTEELSGKLCKQKTAIIVGLDLSNKTDFNIIQPQDGLLECFIDDTMYRQDRLGIIAHNTLGISVTNGSKTLLGAI